MTLSALFGGIIILLNFTPIGYIQLPVIKATIIHVPVIIGSILLGPKIGAGLGTVFGLTSLYNNTFAPTLLSFAFSPVIPVPGTDRGSWTALIIAFLPRILVGVFPYYAYQLLNRLLKGKGALLSLCLSGVIGSMTNTILVMNLIYFLFRDAYGKAYSIAVDVVYKAVLTIIFVNGVPEAVLAAVLTAAVCRALQKYGRLGLS
jgi:Predicted membrane protein